MYSSSFYFQISSTLNKFFINNEDNIYQIFIDYFIYKVNI